MAILSILNPKGGSGKTTLATNLARAFVERDERVLLVDTDPQGSARDWHAAREDNPIPLIALDRPNNMRSVKEMSGYDRIIIDGAAKLEEMVAAAVKVSDAILIPVQPSPYDIWAASDLLALVKARQEVTDGSPQAAFLVSRVIKHTKLGDEIGQALAETGLPVFANRTVQRQIYPQTASEGLTVFDAGNQDAIAEMLAIATEVDQFMRKEVSYGAVAQTA